MAEIEAYPTDDDCIFCKIIKGEIPCRLIESGERAISFLDVSPLSPGHALVIPKGHYATLDEMPAGDVAAIALMLRRVAIAVKAVTGCEGYNILQNNGAVSGQAVFHVHFHIIPRYDGDGLGYRWDAKTLDEAKADELLIAIKEAL